MAVRIRLKRIGKIHHPIYRIVVVDGRKKRDGRVIEEIGKYDPNQQPSLIDVTSPRAQYWLSVGAQPSEQVHRLLVLTGDWAAYKGAKNSESRVQYKDSESAAEAAARAVKAAEEAAEKAKAKAAQAAEEAAAKAQQAESAPEAEAAPEAEEQSAVEETKEEEA